MVKEERRRNRRAKSLHLVRVRPSQPMAEGFEEVLSTVNAARDSLYFIGWKNSYNVGMRLFITFPYSSRADPIKSEYLGQVVRVEQLDGGRRGVAVRLITTINLTEWRAERQPK
jgi:hypothetical protein